MCNPVQMLHAADAFDNKCDMQMKTIQSSAIKKTAMFMEMTSRVRYLRTPSLICHPVTIGLMGLPSEPSVLGYLVFEGFFYRSRVKWSLKRPQWECKQCVILGVQALGSDWKVRFNICIWCPDLVDGVLGSQSRSHWRSPCMEAELLSVWPRPRSRPRPWRSCFFLIQDNFTL